MEKKRIYHSDPEIMGGVSVFPERGSPWKV